MIENCIGIMPLPMGLGLGFKINGENYQVPMAIEEPSVIAACSAIAKIVSEKGSGFICQSTPPVMIGQIQINDIKDFKDAEYKLKINKKNLIEYANSSCQSMVKRGGGVEDIKFRNLGQEFLLVELLVNVKDSMGANVINSIAEFTAPYIREILGQGRIGIRILSNLCTERMTLSEFSVPVESLAWKSASGQEVAEKVLDAQRFAELDQYRATTHNKGIMNGIDAVALALGQDWRAIESAAHSYASIGGRYVPLTSYWIEGTKFHGRIEMPISVGTQGGAIKSNPSYMNTLRILGHPDAQRLSQIMLSVGLAQNFAALRALSIEGIQRGHMNLHARNVAIRAGVPTSLINDCVNFMKVRNRINEKAALMYLKSHQMFCKSQTSVQRKNLSSFYVEINQQPEPLILTILLDCKTQNGSEKTYHLSIEKEPQLTNQETELSAYLFGGNKGYQWLDSFLGLLQSIRYTSSGKISPDLIATQNKLKLLTVLTNLLITHLSIFERQLTYTFVHQLKSLINASNVEDIYHQIKNSIPRADDPGWQPHYISDNKQLNKLIIPYGLNLLLEMSFIFIVQCKSDVLPLELRSLILQEYQNILISLVEADNIFHEKIRVTDGKIHPIGEKDFNKYFEHKKRKMNFQMLVLIDCIGYPEESIPQDLINQIKYVGEIQEVKAVALKSLMNVESETSIDPSKFEKNLQISNNLFIFWLISQKSNYTMSELALDIHRVPLKNKFLQKVEEYCQDIFNKNKLNENQYFDEKMFQDTVEVIQKYYRIEQNKHKI